MRTKPITKEMIINAFQYVKSHRAAARYLNCSYQHYRKYAKLYTDDDGQNIFTKYKNQQGKGIIKHIKNEPDLIELIESTVRSTIKGIALVGGIAKVDTTSEDELPIIVTGKQIGRAHV